MVMWAAGAVSVAVHDEGCGTGGLSTGFDPELFLRRPGAIGVDGPAAAHMGGESTGTGTFATSEETTPMIDDPTPVEQARAARWVTEWITRKIQATEDWVDVADVAGDIMYMLRKHADAMDPLDTVESLRAERDSARQDADGWKSSAHEIEDQRDAAYAALARSRATHTEAEDAWARAKQKPQVWCAGDHEPPMTTPLLQLLDKHGRRWSRWYTNCWCCHDEHGKQLPPHPGLLLWRELLNDFGPLTEVIR